MIKYEDRGSPNVGITDPDRLKPNTWYVDEDGDYTYIDEDCWAVVFYEGNNPAIFSEDRLNELCFPLFEATEPTITITKE